MMSRCLYCNAEFETKDKRKKFCNSSCAAKHNNAKRILSEETKQKISSKLKGGSHNHGNGRSNCCVIEITPCCVCGTLYVGSWLNGFRKTCSDECKQAQKSQAGRLSAAKNVKRSKDEIKLYELCVAHFGNVKHNEPLVDGWDADIIIPDRKIAILWNGIWHREQLPFKNHSLKQVQIRDKLKIAVLRKHGWDVRVFNDNEFTPESAFLILTTNF